MFIIYASSLPHICLISVSSRHNIYASSMHPLYASALCLLSMPPLCLIYASCGAHLCLVYPPSTRLELASPMKIRRFALINVYPGHNGVVYQSNKPRISTQAYATSTR